MRRTKRGRKLTTEHKARAERPKNPVKYADPVSTFDDPELVVHDHNDDRWYSDCRACNPDFFKMLERS